MFLKLLTVGNQEIIFFLFIFKSFRLYTHKKKKKKLSPLNQEIFRLYFPQKNSDLLCKQRQSSPLQAFFSPLFKSFSLYTHNQKKTFASQSRNCFSRTLKKKLPPLSQKKPTMEL